MASFKKDLFISYAHIDNQPLTPERKGWISRFHALLEALLSVRLGRAAKIWRDDKLQGNDVFADEIVDQFAQTAVLISVLTPRKTPNWRYTRNHGRGDKWHAVNDPVAQPRPERFPARVRLAYSLEASSLAGVDLRQQLQDGV